MARVETKVDFIIARLEALPPSPVCVARHQEIEDTILKHREELDELVADVSARVSSMEALRNRVIGGFLALNVLLMVFMDKVKKFLGLIPLVLAVFIIDANRAHSHSWYSGQRDPVTNGNCCGGSDCAILKLEPGVLTPDGDGYIIRLTLEQARKINPARKTPFEALIKRERIQPSEDGNWHICIPTDSGLVRDDFFCFFEPPNA